MTSTANWLRRLEIALVVTGITALGASFAATVQRWSYQQRQESALLRGVAGDPNPGPGAAELAIEDVAEPVGGFFGRDPLALGKIEIPRIGVDAFVREGDDDETLTIAVGHVPGTARPGEKNGNTVLAGHRDTFFRGLRNIRLNDQVHLIVPPHRYEYRVVATQVVAPDEMSVLDSRGTEELTLVTCHPFRFIGSAPNRFIVRAARVEDERDVSPTLGSTLQGSSP